MALRQALFKESGAGDLRCFFMLIICKLNVLGVKKTRFFAVASMDFFLETFPFFWFCAKCKKIDCEKNIFIIRNLFLRRVQFFSAKSQENAYGKEKGLIFFTHWKSHLFFFCFIALNL